MAACCAILKAAQAAITFNGASFPTCYGTGIDPRLQPHLFEAFSRSKVGVFSQAEGSGLGMYIVQTLTERMGGAVRLVYSSDSGTRFQVALQARLAGDEQPAPMLMALTDARVCLVEDNALLAELTAARLKKMFGAVTVVMTAESAIGTIAREKPDVVITDQNLPGMSGLDLASALRKVGFGGVIIGLTGEMGADFPRAFRAAGGGPVLKKPLVLAELQQVLLPELPQQQLRQA